MKDDSLLEEESYGKVTKGQLQTRISLALAMLAGYSSIPDLSGRERMQVEKLRALLRDGVMP